jgi:hypothetical protein
MKSSEYCERNDKKEISYGAGPLAIFAVIHSTI